VSDLSHLFESNRRWAEGITQRNPVFFETLAAQQSPQYLWIGCADSRVPANEIMGLLPGEVFVHRNIANVVVHTDFNCLSCIQYAVEVLHITDIMVVGHYGCGGVRGAMQNTQLGLIDNWLRHIKDVYAKYEIELAEIGDEDERLKRLCELNVMEQVHNVCHTSIVQAAWSRGQELAVHGWVYDLHDGLLQDLHVTVTKYEEIPPIWQMNIRPRRQS
jgi:carbonic anhydrase